MLFVGYCLALNSAKHTDWAYFPRASLILDGLSICFSRTDCKQVVSCNDYSGTSPRVHGCNSSAQGNDSDCILFDYTTGMARVGGPVVSLRSSFLLPPFFQQNSSNNSSYLCFQCVVQLLLIIKVRQTLLLSDTELFLRFHFDLSVFLFIIWIYALALNLKIEFWAECLF